MSVETWTARISTRDPDRFDITRKSGGPDGEVFAPSWAILRPALDARRKATAMRDVADEMSDSLVRAAYHAKINESADDLEREAWERYVPAYMAEMRRSYADNRAAWEGLLARSRVVLVCYCTDAARCHRTLLAGILGKLGADVRGELPS